MGTTSKIIRIKPQGIYTAAVGTNLPTITGTLGSAITMTGWDDAGWIDPEGNVELTFGKTVRLVRPAGRGAAIKGIVTSKSVLVGFSGLEDSEEAIELALGFSSFTSDEMPDGGTGELVYKALAFVTDNFVYHCKKVASAEDVGIVVDDTKEHTVPYKLVGFEEEAADEDVRLWNILKRTAA